MPSSSWQGASVSLKTTSRLVRRGLTQQEPRTSSSCWISPWSRGWTLPMRGACVGRPIAASPRAPTHHEQADPLHLHGRHTQILTFTMFDKTCHSFCNTTRVWPDRNAIYETVCKACKGTGSVLEANLKGEGGAEAPVSLALPAGEEIYHSMECDRLSGSGLWTYRGVLYVCHSFLMFDRPGNERIMVKYSEVTDLKLDRSSGRWLASNVLVIKTKRPALGTLMFSITDPEHVALCMTSIATQVANHNNYQGA